MFDFRLIVLFLKSKRMKKFMSMWDVSRRPENTGSHDRKTTFKPRVSGRRKVRRGKKFQEESDWKGVPTGS